MKSFIICIIITAAILACNAPDKQKQNSPTTPTDSLINNPGTTTADSQYQEGAQLIAANDCLTCHKVEQKSVGPSYRDIANKYQFSEGIVDNLAHTIISGGKGEWGDVAMTAHPNVELNDAKQMVKYILSLKNK